MQSGIKDNHSRGPVGNYLRDEIKKGSELSIVSAYFTIYAFEKLKDQLEQINRFRFLFGEPTFIRPNQLNPELKNPREYKIQDDNSIALENVLQQKSVARECASWLRQKSEIRSMVKPNFLHGKLYHVQHSNGVEKAILGSSNFTVNGLGLGSSPNIELNMIVDSERDRTDLREWFDEIWNNSEGLVEDVKDEVLAYIEHLYAENSPEFIYYKTLYHLFENYLSDKNKNSLLDARTGFYDSEVWNMLYDFQKDGVKGAINKIEKHGGCIVADSVGLGKTFEALAVIKYYELKNQNVLVLCPKKLTANWTTYQASKSNVLNPFKKDRFNYHVLYHTDLGRETGRAEADGHEFDKIEWANYGLVVIDESHNFRGNPIEKQLDDGTIKINRAKFLTDRIIRAGVKTKVLLLSATPVNNTLRDLRNQVSLIIQDEEKKFFEETQIKDYRQTLKLAQTQFTVWADKKNKNRSVKGLLERLDSSFFKLLDELTIARSRKHIIKFYDFKNVGKFPERLPPESIYPSIDLQNRFFTYDALNKKILQYRLSVFNPSKYVKREFREEYERRAGRQILGFKQSDREHFLINMMKVNFLKRLESSIESFQISMERTINKIEKLETKIKQFQQHFKNGQLNLFDFEPDENELEDITEEEEKWQVGKKLKFELQHIELNKWLTDLEKDRQALNELYNSACAIDAERDAKLAELKELIKNKVSGDSRNKKVLIFTAFADTAQYLYNNVQPWLSSQFGIHSALIAGGRTATTYGGNEFSHILTNFSPISKQRALIPKMSQQDEIDVLIATDCISEGQNLQDCDYLINYDIHWNPVRIIQRFGRIDRLGSRNNKIQLVNFWPTKDLDNYINLKERVEARMALVDVTATGEDNILNTEQIEELITDELKYRNRQLKRLQKEVLDLEDLDESISLTDFTLDDFRIELSNFIENNKERLDHCPLGLYAVVPVKSDLDNITSGVIYCLKQKGDTTGTEEVNPLQPYFLVYIKDNGEVRYNYIHAKQILELFRGLCQGKTSPNEELCELFNKQTENGQKMDKFTGLLTSAIDEIIRVFRKRVTQKLTTDRGGTLMPKNKNPNDKEQFELITWLVIS
ncbi:MAG TPA: helicase-related protein [Hanamia sp.]|nr:helicase-related protein [Hanamia sp.]